MDELHDKGYLMTMDLYVPDNYILGTKEVTFHYNPYEIAPYATGDTELTISYGQLKAIMKNNKRFNNQDDRHYIQVFP